MVYHKSRELLKSLGYELFSSQGYLLRIRAHSFVSRILISYSIKSYSFLLAACIEVSSLHQLESAKEHVVRLIPSENTQKGESACAAAITHSRSTKTVTQIHRKKNTYIARLGALLMQSGAVTFSLLFYTKR